MASKAKAGRKGNSRKSVKDLGPKDAKKVVGGRKLTDVLVSNV